jgi:hypothetical protein
MDLLLALDSQNRSRPVSMQSQLCAKTFYGASDFGYLDDFQWTSIVSYCLSACSTRLRRISMELGLRRHGRIGAQYRPVLGAGTHNRQYLAKPLDLTKNR